MKMIQFKDELVPLKQCKVGTVVALKDSTNNRFYYGHIMSFKDLDGELLITIRNSDGGSYNHYPENLIWNV